VILTSVLWITGFFLVASALCGAHAEQHKPAKAATFGYVANVDNDTVSVIDTASNTVVATINLPVGAIPKGVATTPDGTHAYVINDGNFTVSVIDTASNTVATTIPADDPSAVAITPDGTHAYVTSLSEDTVSVINTASNTVVATIPVGAFPIGVAITPEGTRPPERDDRSHQPLAYVTNELDSTVSVINTGNNTVVATIPVGQEPTGVSITPDGTHAYVTNSFDNTVSVIDTARSKVVATIPVGNAPVAVAITPDETNPYEHDDRAHQPLAYVTNANDNTVSVIETASNTVVATILVGQLPVAVAITPDGTNPFLQDDRSHQPLAYVTNFAADTVSVIDTASNKVVTTIPVGKDPIAVAFATVAPSHSSSEQ
jgi:YVTN family beta-propeller protein